MFRVKKAASVKGMKNDYSTALENAAHFLDAAGAVANYDDPKALSTLGTGWATLALALSQDRQSHAIAESLLQWLNTPTAEGFDTMMALVAEWAGVVPPEVEVIGSSELPPDAGLDTD